MSSKKICMVGASGKLEGDGLLGRGVVGLDLFLESTHVQNPLSVPDTLGLLEHYEAPGSSPISELAG